MTIFNKYQSSVFFRPPLAINALKKAFLVKKNICWDQKNCLETTLYRPKVHSNLKSVNTVRIKRLSWLNIEKEYLSIFISLPTNGNHV